MSWAGFGWYAGMRDTPSAVLFNNRTEIWSSIDVARFESGHGRCFKQSIGAQSIGYPSDIPIDIEICTDEKNKPTSGRGGGCYPHGRHAVHQRRTKVNVKNGHQVDAVKDDAQAQKSRQ
jgi:hypothetical protein